MKYTGKLYGKAGRAYFPMIQTAADVDAMEAERDRYKAAYEVAIYNLIGVAGTGHPGVSEAQNIVTYVEIP